MKSAIHSGIKSIEVKDVPKPSPGKGECLVKIKACSICGSDVWWLNDKTENEPVHGHESVGEIVEVGEGFTKFVVGDRVVCYAIKGCGECFYCRKGVPTNCASKKFVEGGFQEYSVFTEELLFPCPDDFDDITASLLSDAIGVPLRGLRRLPPEKNDTVSVWGLGPLGLLQIMFLKAAGVKKIIGIDTVDGRLEKARELGAEVLVNPIKCDSVEEIKKATDGLGTDKAYIYVRLPKVTEDVFKSTKEGASVCTFVGLDGNYELQEWYERTLAWSFYFTPDEYEDNLKFIRDNKIDLSKVVTDVFPLEKINEAFAKRFEDQENSLKIVVTTGNE
jgi:threonine dehydrogenase-like Zn-dependent dehydrogenase